MYKLLFFIVSLFLASNINAQKTYVVDDSKVFHIYENCHYLKQSKKKIKIINLKDAWKNHRLCHNCRRIIVKKLESNIPLSEIEKKTILYAPKNNDKTKSKESINLEGKEEEEIYP